MCRSVYHIQPRLVWSIEHELMAFTKAINNKDDGMIMTHEIRIN